MRDSLPSSDLRDVPQREPGRSDETAEWDVPDERQDFAFEGAEVDELAIPGFPVRDRPLAIRSGLAALPGRRAAVCWIAPFQLEPLECREAGAAERLELFCVGLGEAGVADAAVAVGNFPAAALELAETAPTWAALSRRSPSRWQRSSPRRPARASTASPRR